MTDNNKTIILITGASGFIGSRIALYLHLLGNYEIYGISRETMTDNSDINWVIGDYGDSVSMEYILNNIQPNIIIHCAGLSPHQGNFTEDEYRQVNVENSESFLNECKKCKSIKGFINASTIGVYGHPVSDNGVVSEVDECMPLAPYPKSKLSFENMLLKTKEIKSLSLRIANIPGKDAFINYVLNNNKVSFFGDTPYLRDYIHMDDLVDLVERSIAYLINGGNSSVLNAASGIGHSFQNIVDEIELQTEVIIERQNNPPKQGDVIKIMCNIDHTKKMTGWSPQKTSIKDIVKYAITNKNV